MVTDVNGFGRMLTELSERIDVREKALVPLYHSLNMCYKSVCKKVCMIYESLIF